jgi:hypothetical protein
MMQNQSRPPTPEGMRQVCDLTPHKERGERSRSREGVTPRGRFRDDSKDVLSSSYRYLGQRWQHNSRTVIPRGLAASCLSYIDTELFSDVQLAQVDDDTLDELVYIRTGLLPSTRITDLRCRTKGELRNTIANEGRRTMLSYPDRLTPLARNFSNTAEVAQRYGMPIKEFCPNRRDQLETSIAPAGRQPDREVAPAEVPAVVPVVPGRLMARLTQLAVQPIIQINDEDERMGVAAQLHAQPMHVDTRSNVPWSWPTTCYKLGEQMSPRPQEQSQDAALSRMQKRPLEATSGARMSDGPPMSAEQCRRLFMQMQTSGAVAEAATQPQTSLENLHHAAKIARTMTLPDSDLFG